LVGATDWVAVCVGCGGWVTPGSGVFVGFFPVVALGRGVALGWVVTRGVWLLTMEVLLGVADTNGAGVKVGVAAGPGLGPGFTLVALGVNGGATVAVGPGR